MSKLNVLITGIGGGGVGEQVLKALKFSEIDLSIIGADISNVCANINEVNEFIILPPASEERKYINAINNVIDRYRLKAIFMGSEPELKLYSRNREFFEEKGVYLPLNTDSLINLCLNKYDTYRELSDLGFSLAKYTKIDSIEDCNQIDYFPVVLKPNTASGGSANVHLVFDRDELLMFSSYMLKHKIDVVAQHYIGSPEDEYTIGVSSDKNGKVLGSIIIKRLLINGLSISARIAGENGEPLVISSGISQGHTIYNNIIAQQAESIAKALDSRGPLNIQGRFVNGKLIIFEINPRLSGTTSLRAMVGYNEPLNMLKENILKQEGNYSYKEGIILRRLEEVLIGN